MKVCLLGANGYLGPWVVQELERSGDYDLRITDVRLPDNSPHETMQVDVSDLDQVRRAADGCDVIVNCSVLRPHRQIAWEVNTAGTYNAMRVAVDMGHERMINTGPHFTITGEPYHTYDFGIVEEVPAHAGTNLYALSKSAGQEICRIFADEYPIHVLCMLFLNFRRTDPGDPRSGAQHGLIPFSVTFPDAARAIRCALEVDVRQLPSRNEVFFVTTDLPHGKYSNDKARRLLGWEPQDSLEKFYRKSLQP
ncbi:MAG: NAD(P)-dependent oxidoreductase [bacterium]|nr:NAD(P)-dependent oxidoreductase [bacterium]